MFSILDEFSNFVRSFYDDCIIFCKQADHIRHIKMILDKFAKQEVDFLGYVVSKNGIKPQNNKTEISGFQTPKYFRMEIEINI